MNVILKAFKLRPGTLAVHTAAEGHYREGFTEVTVESGKVFNVEIITAQQTPRCWVLEVRDFGVDARTLVGGAAIKVMEEEKA